MFQAEFSHLWALRWFSHLWPQVVEASILSRDNCTQTTDGFQDVVYVSFTCGFYFSSALSDTQPLEQGMTDVSPSAPKGWLSQLRAAQALQPISWCCWAGRVFPPPPAQSHVCLWCAQSCPALWGSVTCMRPAGLLCPWGFPGKVLEWAVTSFSGDLRNPRKNCLLSLLCWRGRSLSLVHLVGAVCWVASVMPHSLRPHGLYPTRLLCPRHSQLRMLEWVATPSSRDLPDPGIERGSLTSPALARRAL